MRHDLYRYLRESGSNTLIFAGCSFPNCPSYVDLRGDAISGRYDRGIEECRAIGVEVLGLSATLDWLAR